VRHVLALAIACASAVVFQQAPNAQPSQIEPRFDAATIKPSGPDSPSMAIRRAPGGRLMMTNMPLGAIIAWAFEVDDGRLDEGGRRLESRFDVNAVAPAAAPRPGETQRMMRALLFERFGLRVHHEQRESRIYSLITERGGPKVAPSSSAETGPDPFRMSQPGLLSGTRVTTDMLVKVLSNELRVPVVNATGYSGFFDFSLRWRPDGAVSSPSDSEAPSLFTAVREQLGFRLEPRRAPVDVVVIDAIQLSPTDN